MQVELANGYPHGAECLYHAAEKRVILLWQILGRGWYGVGCLHLAVQSDRCKMRSEIHRSRSSLYGNVINVFKDIIHRYENSLMDILSTWGITAVK
jgi:hypothetical protein